MAVHFNIEQRPLGADAWIDHHHVQRLRRKVRDGTVQEKSGIADILGRDLVAQVKESCARINAEDDTFHGCHIGRILTKISRQGDDGIRHVA